MSTNQTNEFADLAAARTALSDLGDGFYLTSGVTLPYRVLPKPPYLRGEPEVRMADKPLQVLIVGMTMMELRERCDAAGLDLYCDHAGNICVRKPIVSVEVQRRRDHSRHLYAVQSEVAQLRISRNKCAINFSCQLDHEHPEPCAITRDDFELVMAKRDTPRYHGCKHGHHLCSAKVFGPCSKEVAP